MNKHSLLRIVSAGFLLTGICFGQTAESPSPTTAPNASSPAANASPFPPVDSSNFTATLPTKETVDAFLKAQLGFDSNRIWQVNAIRNTIAKGFSEVTVIVAEKGTSDKPQGFHLLITPDQKFAIQDATLVPFGANPFADARAILEKRADGPSRGAKANDLLIVEFSDMECPHCKAAEPVMQNLLRDYPMARVVYQNFPLSRIHPWSHKAAAFFFKFLSNVFAGQEQTTESNVDEMMKSATTKAGADADKAAACAVTPAALAKVDASVALADELAVAATPTLYVNGRAITMGPNLTYELLQQIVNYQAQLDGLKLPPTMTTLPK